MLNYQTKTQIAVVYITSKGFRQIVVRFDSEFYTDTVVAFELIGQKVLREEYLYSCRWFLCALLFSFNAPTIIPNNACRISAMSTTRHVTKTLVLLVLAVAPPHETHPV